MDQNPHIPDRLRRALIHDLRGLLSPILTISEGRSMFGPPGPDEAAQEYLIFLQASSQIKELLSSWELAFSQHDPGTPGPVDALVAITTAAALLDNMIPEESRPQIELPAALPSCTGHELLLRQAFADVFRFLAGLGTGQSRIVVTGTASGVRAEYVISLGGIRCTDNEIADYLHTSQRPSRYVYGLVGARLLLEKQDGELKLTSNEQTGAVVQVTMPC